MDLQGVKNYLKVDFDEDDALISMILEASRKWIEDAVGVYDASDPRVELLTCNICSELYETRTYTIKDSEKVRNANKTLMLQLQLKYEE